MSRATIGGERPRDVASATLSRRSLLFGAVAYGLLACNKTRPRTSSPRVVSLSPNMTEASFAIGAGSLLVGRSRFCDYPPEALALPQVGGFVDPSFEAILALAPTLVIGARGPTGRALVDTLEARGIDTYFPPTASIAEVDAMVLGLAERLDHATQGEQLVARMREQRAKIARAVEGKPRPRVLMLFGISPIVAGASGSFVDELLTLAGGSNVVEKPSAATAYPQLSLEQVIALDPDILLDAAMMERRGDEALGPTWRVVRAVREGRVAVVRSDAALRPGPRIAEGAAEIARAIHPGLELTL